MSPVARAVLPLVATAAVMLGSTAPARSHDEDPVAQVRALYAQAAYEDALAAIEAVDQPASTSWPVRRGLAETRVLCLFALGRAAEARRSMTDLVDLDPLFTLPEASPSLRATYLKVRAQRLPSVVRARLSTGREAFARGDYLQAQADFALVRDLVADPALQASELEPLLSDIGLIAASYLELSARRTGTSPQATASARPPVQPPTAIDEQVPPWLPGHVRPSLPYEARVEVVIGASGQVESARVLESNERKYDVHVLNAVRNWHYTPAFQDGVAVTFTKVVSVVIAPR